MLNKLTSVTLVAALVIALYGTSAFANDSSKFGVKTDPANVPSDAPANKGVKHNER